MLTVVRAVPGARLHFEPGPRAGVCARPLSPDQTVLGPGIGEEVRKMIHGIHAAAPSSCEAPGLASPQIAGRRFAARPSGAVRPTPRPFRTRFQPNSFSKNEKSPDGAFFVFGGGGDNHITF